MDTATEIIPEDSVILPHYCSGICSITASFSLANPDYNQT